MLEIVVPGSESFDETNEVFIWNDPAVLHLEHTLVTVSKWEETHKKPFLSKEPRTNDEMLDYIRCMDVDKHPMNVYQRLSEDNIKAINDYIADPHTASTVHDLRKNQGHQQTITAEVIYYWMIIRNIPIEFQNWHLNKLLMLIRIFDAEQGSGAGKNGKMSRAEAAAWQRQENARRLAARKK